LRYDFTFSLFLTRGERKRERKRTQYTMRSLARLPRWDIRHNASRMLYFGYATYISLTIIRYA
jgi:hypothetical protein